MTRRATTALVFCTSGLWVALQAAGVTLLALTWNVPRGSFADPPAASIRDAVVACVFAVVGLLLASKRPANLIGWLFLAVAASLALTLMLGRYALYAVVAHPGSLRGGVVAASLSQAVWVILISSVALLLLLFPHGRLPSRRWRPLVVLLALSVASAWVGQTTVPGALPEPFATYDNPLGVDGLTSVDRVLFAGSWLMLVVLVAGAVSLVGRFRRAEGDERQQYKLFTFAALALPVTLVVLQSAEGLLGSGVLGNGTDAILSTVPALVSALLPIATAIAILRYRLYEIDRLVSRTLVYVALTVILGTAYVGLVLAGQALFSSFAGGSNLAIAVSTLVVAALFQPVRSRLQHFVDRRFYRSRYDAQRTLEAFGARLREQVALDTLSADLRAVVAETMQPAHASLWLRKETAQ